MQWFLLVLKILSLRHFIKIIYSYLVFMMIFETVYVAFIFFILLYFFLQ